MLYWIRIRNFALIDELELEFGCGLNVLTGETGAGKSIILDAIDVILGGKINPRLIRQGTQRALLETGFRVDEQLKDWLKERELDPLEEDILICSREIALVKDNLRSRSRVNGILVNRQIIAELRGKLLEITAQGQTVELMIPQKQRELLDLYGGKQVLEQREQVKILYEERQKLQQALAKKRQSDQERLQRLDLLQYQLEEFQKTQLETPEELEQLEQEKTRLAHVVELQQLSRAVYQLLYQQEQGEKAAVDLLGEAEGLMQSMINYDQSLESVGEIVRSALNLVVEAGHQVYSYGESLEAEPERLEAVESRIRQLNRICRKYGPTLAEAIAYQAKLEQELLELNQDTEAIESLEKEEQKLQEQLEKVCEQLTKLRQEAAWNLEEQLTSELKPLGMEKVIFVCRLFHKTITASGADEIVYYFSPNPGEKIQPLSLTASGGEMSRFLLALKACFVPQEAGAKTLVFDEIDVGVSGKVARAIATKLHHLSQVHQILCVTHQPLIAAMADHHFRVTKELIDQQKDLRTVIRITNLDNSESRREELANLSSGQTDQETLAFAESLQVQAAANRRSEDSRFGSQPLPPTSPELNQEDDS